MPRIRLKNTDNIDIAIRKFKKKCMDAGVMEDVRKKEFYEKPTWKSKRMKKEAKNKEKRRLNSNKINRKRLY